MGLARKNALLAALTAVLCWGLSGGAAYAAKPAAPSAVQELVYGEILFEFYQDRYLEAITRQLVAEQRSELRFHADEAQLLSGGMYLAFGQQAQAEAIFDRLLLERASPEVQQAARLQLAQSHYQRGAFASTVALLADRQWDRDSAVEAQSLLARSLLGLGQYAQAAAVLQGLENPKSAAFARYNLGVALAGLGDFGAAARELSIVGNLVVERRRGFFRRGLFKRRHTVDETIPALRDKARLALGYALIRNGNADAALQTLEGVSLDGPYASASLLGAGWAAAELQRFDIALNAWRVLQDRDAADPAVQEAWFAVPYALGELAAHDEAVSAFEHSIAAIEDEDRSLVDAIDALNREGLASLFLTLDEAAQWDAGWQLSEAPDHPLSRYLYTLLADNIFQQHLRDYRDLKTLADLLERKRADLVSYDSMISARETRFAQHAPLAAAVVDGSRLAGLRGRAATLRARIEDAVRDNDYLALADRDELDQLQRLARTDAVVARLPASAVGDASGRQRVLRGLLTWRLSAGFPARVHELKRELAAIETQCNQAETYKRRLAVALQAAPDTHVQFTRRLAVMAPRIATTQVRIAQTLALTDQRLVDLATSALNERRLRLAQYLDQARYALAAIHDRASAEGS